MSMLAPFPSHLSPSLFHGTTFPTIFPKHLISGVNETITDTKNIFCQISRIINNNEFSNTNQQILNVLKTEINSNIKKLSKLLKNASLNLTTEQIEDIQTLKNDGRILLTELGEPTSDTSFSQPPPANEESLKEIYAQFNLIKTIFSKFLISAKITTENIDQYISTQKDICNNLMVKKIIIEQSMDKDGLKYSNYNIIIFVKDFERILQMITESTFQLEEAVKKFKALGSIQQAINAVKEFLEDEGEMSNRKAEKIHRQLEHSQEEIDAFEIVCNNLTAHLAELATISGNSIISQKADYLIELQDYKSELQDLREKFEKALIKPKMAPPKPTTKEASTNTVPQKFRSVSTFTELPKEIQIKKASEIPEIREARLFHSKQFLLGFLPVLFLGLIILTFFSEKQPPNNWRRMYGPQLDYMFLPPQ